MVPMSDTKEYRVLGCCRVWGFSSIGLAFSGRFFDFFFSLRNKAEKAAISSAVNATDSGAAKLKKVTSNKEYGIECKLLEKGLRLREKEFFRVL